MSHVRCPYCGASEGRCTSSGAGRFVTECRSCGRVVEEHRSEVEELFVERAQDTPLCIVTPDFSENECYRAPPLEDDPYENIGFITAFSTWSLELSPLFTATSTSFSGHLAELERLLLDPVYPTGGSNADVPGVSMSMVDTLRAYFQIVEVSSILGLERDFCDHAIQLFRDCASTTYLRNRNIEALATAALVQAIREAQEPRTLQEISAAATIPQKEIAKYMKVLSDALKLSQPINSNSIAVHMPRFCNLLQLSKATQDLATHIGEVVINKSFCTRRNPISISAAAIYLSCQLEDKRKTQTEICKATGLTEVTLRKVYKELLENLSDLLPPNYTPAVAPEKAFPVSAAALGRVCATRVAAGGSLVPSIASPADSSVATTYVTGPGITLNSSGISGAAVYPEGNSGASSGAGVSCILPSPASLVRATGPLPSVNAIPGVHTKSAGASSTDGSRLPTHLFKMPAGVTNSSASPAVDTGPAGAAASQDRTQNFELDRDLERHKEKERERNDSDSIPFGLSTVPPTLKGSMPAVSSANIGLPFLHFRPFMQDLAKVTWPPQALYSVPVLRPDENVSGQVSERNREDELLHLGLKGPQYMSVLPGVVGDGTAGMSASIPSTQLKTFQSIGLSSSGARDQPGTLERTEEEEVGKEAEHNEQGDANSPPLHQLSSGSSIGNLNFGAAGLAANARPPMFQSFPQSLWGFSSPGSMPVGVFPPHFLAPCGGLLQNLPQFGETNSGADKGGRVTIPARETPSQVTLPSTEAAETMGRLPSGSTTTQLSGKASQASMTQLLPTAWPPFRPLYIPPMNSNNITDDGHSDGSVATRRDAGHLEGVGAKSGPPLRHLNSGAGNNLSALSTTDFLPNLSIGINAGLQTSSCLPGSATSHRSDESGK